MMGGGMGSFGFAGIGLGSVIGLVFLALIIWVTVTIIKNNNDRNNSVSSQLEESPLDILKKRYVKGEITQEQFNSLKNDIKTV